MHPQDILDVKSTLKDFGLYKVPSYGMTPYGDMTMIDGIKTFQKNNGLRVDGVMKPGGETETAMNKFIRKGTYLTTAALQGLSLGWADEIEGAIRAPFYGLASLIPSKNLSGESVLQATKRGYTEYRDLRRDQLRQGNKEMPRSMATTEFASSLLTPSIKIAKVGKAVPLAMKSLNATKNAAFNGAVYGAGRTEGSLEDHAYNSLGGIASGLVGRAVSKSINKNITGGATSIGVRTLTNRAIEQGSSSLVDKQVNKGRQIY